MPPELLASMVLLPIDGSCESVALPAISVKLGWVALGTPDAEIWLIHFDVTAAKLSTHPVVEADGLGHCADAKVPLMSVNAGWEAVGTPLVEIWLIH